MNNTSIEFSNWEYRNIALAAVAQCAVLVNELATKGEADDDQINACVAPLLILDADSTQEIYPRVADLNTGLNTLQIAMGDDGNKQFPEAVRYFLGIQILQQKLAKQPVLQSRIRSGLQALPANSNENKKIGNIDQTHYAEIARLYQNTISTLSYRIHVAGNPEHLRNTQVADKIRTLLLAGIRSAVLWHQLGGRRWHLLIYRKRIRESIAHIRRTLLSVN